MSMFYKLGNFSLLAIDHLKLPKNLLLSDSARDRTGFYNLAPMQYHIQERKRKAQNRLESEQVTLENNLQLLWNWDVCTAPFLLQAIDV